MAIAAPEPGTRTRKRSTSTRRTQSSDALSTLTQPFVPPPPVPQIDLPPLPNLPAPQPVRVEDPVAMLARAVAGLPGLPTINTLQTLASLAESTAQNLLQSRLAAQEQALQRALGLANLGMDRARIALDIAREQRERAALEDRIRQAQEEADETRRDLALGVILDAIRSGTSEEDSRMRIETLFAVYPELRALIPQSQIEALLRARWGEQEAGSAGRTFGPTLGSRIAQHFRSLPGAMARDLAQGRELLNSILGRLSFNYVMGHGR